MGQDDLGNNTENVVSLTLTDSGKDKFAEATKTAYEDGQDSIGIYYDGQFVSVRKRKDRDHEWSGPD